MKKLEVLLLLMLISFMSACNAREDIVFSKTKKQKEIDDISLKFELPTFESYTVQGVTNYRGKLEFYLENVTQETVTYRIDSYPKVYRESTKETYSVSIAYLDYETKHQLRPELTPHHHTALFTLPTKPSSSDSYYLLFVFNKKYNIYFYF